MSKLCVITAIETDGWQKRDYYNIDFEKYIDAEFAKKSDVNQSTTRYFVNAVKRDPTMDELREFLKQNNAECDEIQSKIFRLTELKHSLYSYSEIASNQLSEILIAECLKMNN